MAHLKSTQLVELMDASYDLAESGPAWSKRVLTALMSFAGTRTGASFHFTSGYAKGAFELRSVEGDTALGPTGLSTLVSWRPPIEAIEAIIGRTQGNTAASATQLGARLALTPEWRNCWPAPIVDSLGVVSRDVNGDGFCAFVGVDHVGVLTPRESRLLGKLATHIGAGDRLRRAGSTKRIDDAEAILAPDGNVLHAQGIAIDKREALDEGRRRRNQSRSTKDDADKALEVWKGLVAGRWSLVDHFDTDGKRLLLAIKNSATVDKRADLTARERRVCALVAMGHRDKEIAYMLGLTLASITASMHRARRKLGVRSRTELANAWRSKAGQDA